MGHETELQVASVVVIFASLIFLRYGPPRVDNLSVGQALVWQTVVFTKRWIWVPPVQNSPPSLSCYPTVWEE